MATADTASLAWESLRRALAAGAGSPELREALRRLVLAAPPSGVGPEGARVAEAILEVLEDPALSAAEALARAWALIGRVDALSAAPGRRGAVAPAAASLRAPEPEDDDGSSGLALDLSLAELELDDPVVARLAAIGVATVHDLVLLAPNQEQSFAPVLGAGRPLPEGPVAVGGRVRGRVTRCQPRARGVGEVSLFGAGPTRVRWRGPLSASDLQTLGLDEKVVVVGHHDGSGVVEQGRVARSDAGRAWTVEYGTPDDEAVREAWAALGPELAKVDDPLPPAAAARDRVAALGPAVAAVGVRGRQAEEARRRMALHELALHAFATGWARFQAGGERGLAHAVAHRAVVELEWMRHIRPLTHAQQAAFEQIKRDLLRPTPMQRVLYGSTAHEPELLALLASLVVVEGRSQVLVVSPEPAAALIRSEVWGGLLRAVGVTSLLWTGELRRADADAIRKGEVSVVFGGPAIVEQAIEWRRLGLVVFVQSGRYGVPASGPAIPRSPRPDLLVVASTPVAFERLGRAWPAWDLSVMTWHVERSVGGRVWREDEREAAFRALGEAVVRGHQAIVAFPITRAGTDLLDLREASALAATLKREVLGEVEVALFHGAMTAGEREAAVSGLASGKVRVIIATTLMEILPPLERPVDVLIEHSDRMDLQRLLSWRRLITPQGRMHFVVGGQPRPWGLRAVERLALGEPDEEVVAACPEGFPPLGEEPAGGGLSGAWCIAADADLIPLARGVAHALLRADPQCREALGAMWWRLAWSAWDRVGGGLNPLPPARPVAGRKRRRRRKRRGVA